MIKDRVMLLETEVQKATEVCSRQYFALATGVGGVSMAEYGESTAKLAALKEDLAGAVARAGQEELLA